MSVYSRLLGVMGEIDGIAKRGRNTQQNYSYLTAEDVFEEVRPLFVKHGLVLLASCISQDTLEGQTKSGGTTYLTRVRMVYTLVETATGEKVDLPWEGQGQDSGDKGIYKGYTGSLKTFLRQLLMIAADDDPKNDGTAPRRPAQRPPAQPQKPIEGPKPADKPAPQKDLTEQAKEAFGADKVSEEKTVSKQDRKDLWNLAKSKGYTEEQFGAELANMGYASSADIPLAKLKEARDFFGNVAPPFPA